MKKNFKHIELFAGCGGMSLGLEAAGFDLYFANELSPMASETFAYNILGEDISSAVDSSKSNVLWINSNYERRDLKERLRENPFDYVKGKYNDLDGIENLQGKLLVGNINHLLKHLAKNKSLIKKLRSENIDLVSGGPPCQSFSLAGKRVKDDHKNQLPLSFARFAGLVQPKVVLLENVKGITAPFTENDNTYVAWLEVAKAFALEGYIPFCMLLNSKYFGVPQNRPRFILLGLRQDIFKSYNKVASVDIHLKSMLDNSRSFYKKVNSYRKQLNVISEDDLVLYDIESCKPLFDGNILPKVTTDVGSFISVKDAIDDLRKTGQEYFLDKLNKGYSKNLNSIFTPKAPLKGMLLENHEHRKHNYLVRARFRLYQVLNDVNGHRKDVLNVVFGKDNSEESIQNVYAELSQHKLLVESDGETKLSLIDKIDSFKKYITLFPTKKHSQRALKEHEPAPAQLTIPDDVCHYNEDELRTVTVREMARIQSFPDWFIFKSKTTTGGTQRSFEVPQYTQVGNAVPPLLAYQLGSTISNILKKVCND